jgi:hypothetical protein
LEGLEHGLSEEVKVFDKLVCSIISLENTIKWQSLLTEGDIVLYKRNEHALEIPVILHGLKIAGIVILGLHFSRSTLARKLEIKTHQGGPRYSEQKAAASVWRFIARIQLLPLHNLSAKVVPTVRARIRVIKISIAERLIISYLY